MKKLFIVASILATFTTFVHAEPRSWGCTFVENWLNGKATCLYMGNKGEKWKVVLITPREKTTIKAAAAMLFKTVQAFDMSDYHPESITVLTDDEARGPSLMVNGAAAHIPKSPKEVDPNLEAEFSKGIKVCSIVNWESQCKPLKQSR